MEPLDNAAILANTETRVAELSIPPHHAVRLRARANRHDLEQCAQNVWDARLCTWPDCHEYRARELHPDYADAPLCIGHIYAVWQRARDLAERKQVTNPAIVIGLQRGAKRVTLEQPVARSGWIYYLRIGDAIKVGYASHLGRRLRQYPPNSEFLMAHRGTRSDELALHGLFGHFRTAGREWYTDAPEILEHIEKMKARHGITSDPRPTSAGDKASFKVQMRARSGARGVRRSA